MFMLMKINGTLIAIYTGNLPRNKVEDKQFLMFVILVFELVQFLCSCWQKKK